MSDGLTFGASVTVTATLRRREHTKRDPNGRNRYIKEWARSDDSFLNQKMKKAGIFLGYRTLSNGETEYLGEDGASYSPDNYFRAALVCLSPRENPVYVPLDAIQTTCAHGCGLPAGQTCKAAAS